MKAHVGVVTEALLEGFHVAVDGGGVLAMHHDGQWRQAEDAVERLVTVDEHIAGGTAHKELHAGNAVGVKLRQQVGVVVGGAEEEGVVHVALRSGQPLLLVECFKGGGLRHGVGHIEVAGHSSSRRGAAFAVDVGFRREAGLAEVHMVVDDARQHVAARGIDRLVGKVCLQGSCFLPGDDVNDTVILNNNRANESLAFVDYGSSCNDCSHGCCPPSAAVAATACPSSSISPRILARISLAFE